MRERASREDILKVMVSLHALWLKHPHQRLGQLLLNLARNGAGATDLNVLWNLDEDELFQRIKDCDWHAP